MLLKQFRRIAFFIFGLFLMLSCEENELKDSDVRISPIDHPGLAITMLFFESGNITFFEDGWAPATKDTSLKIRWNPGTGKSKDTLFAKFTETLDIGFVENIDSFQISSLYLGIPGTTAFWKFGVYPSAAAANMKLIFPNTIRPGIFPMRFGGELKKTKIIKGKDSVAIAPERTILVNLQ